MGTKIINSSRVYFVLILIAYKGTNEKCHYFLPWIWEPTTVAKKNKLYCLHFLGIKTQAREKNSKQKDMDEGGEVF